MPHFTPTEQRLLAVLGDGLDHHRDELMACLSDDMTERSTLRTHFFRMKKKLHPVGQDIVCIRNGAGFRYRQVRLLHSSHDGKR